MRRHECPDKLKTLQPESNVYKCGTIPCYVVISCCECCVHSVCPAVGLKVVVVVVQLSG